VFVRENGITPAYKMYQHTQIIIIMVHVNKFNILG